MVSLIKKFISFFTVTAVLLPLFACGVQGAGKKPSVSAKCAVLMNADTLEVLYSLCADEKRPMASTTKIMTSLLALEYAEPSLEITVNKEAVSVEGTSVGLKEGDRITLETLVYAMLLESGNDAANVTAFAVAGSIGRFAELMNRRALQLGMKNTCFKNPSGLPEQGHYSTAYDMALLASFALGLPKFAAICSAKTARVSFGTPTRECTFSNHNKLLDMFEGAVGMKTGFTKSAGRCLVSAAVRDGVSLVAVTFCAPDDWNDHIKLLEYGFACSQLNRTSADLSTVRLRVAGSTVTSVGVKAQIWGETLSVPDGCSISFYIQPFLTAPVSAGECIGFAAVKTACGREVRRYNLISCDDAPSITDSHRVEKTVFFEKIKEFIKSVKERLFGR